MTATINKPCENCDNTGEVINVIHEQEGLADCPDCDDKGWIKEVI